MIGEVLPALPAPGYGDRVAIMGNSGEGKSELLLRLIDSVPNVILLNTKGDPAFRRVGPTIKRDRDIYKYTEGRVNYIPEDGWTDSMPLKEQFFGWAYRHAQRSKAPLVIAVDEVNDVCPSAQMYPRRFQKCVKQGRFIGLGIWCGSQEPVRSPSFAFGQAQMRYLFYLGWSSHRKVADAWFETDVPWETMPERSHKFLLKMPGGMFGPMRLSLAPNQAGTDLATGT